MWTWFLRYRFNGREYTYTYHKAFNEQWMAQANLEAHLHAPAMVQGLPREAAVLDYGVIMRRA